MTTPKRDSSKAQNYSLLNKVLLLPGRKEGTKSEMGGDRGRGWEMEVEAELDLVASQFHGGKCDLGKCRVVADSHRQYACLSKIVEKNPANNVKMD